MAEPDWKTELRGWIDGAVCGSVRTQDDALASLLPYIDAAYQRGLQAGRSQAGYSTRRKSKEGPCRTGTAGAAGSTPASTTGEP
jgi:hypothetical protein